jgi:hypothetical protein
MSNEGMSIRFWNKVSKKEPDQCWEWTAYTLRNGYGWFYTPEGPKGAHRVAAFLSGIIPSIAHELHILHKCDNPKCCNPNHLFSGTNADNAADKATKKRGRTLPKFGADNPASKLTLKEVNEIKEKYANEKLSQSKLAKEYGMQQPSISRILNGVRWGAVS